MGLGSGSAKPGLIFGLAILGLWALTQPTYGAIFNIGDYNGWTFNVNNWPQDKSFQAGDVLVFRYMNAHNVVQVDKDGYENCTSSPKGAVVYQSGRDKIKLNKGPNYFICSIAGHCQSGMRIFINAS